MTSYRTKRKNVGNWILNYIETVFTDVSRYGHVFERHINQETARMCERCARKRENISSFYGNPTDVVNLLHATLKENADEINSYFGLNVDPTARPLVINVDYNEAIYNVTKDIRRVIAGTQKESNLSALEKSYYSACIKYLSGEDVTAEDWAAYKSRISAVGVLVDGNYKPLQRQYLEESDGEVPNILASLEKNAFIQLIMGEQPMDYFDTFVQEWYAQGGQELTEKIREENS